MRILAFDTATNACSAALWRDGGVVARRLEPMARGHAERLMPMILEVMAVAGEDFAALDAIAVTNGPGSFTGLRIGLAAARGLALAGALPCLAVTTLEAVAAGVPEAERRDRALLVVLDAKRDDVYAQSFAPDLKPIGEPRPLLPGELPTLLVDVSGPVSGPVVVAGDAAERAREALAKAGIATIVSTAAGMPDAAVVAALAAARWTPGKAVEKPRPLYLRSPSTTPPKTRRRGR